MSNWQKAPSAKDCHPPGGEEHFSPLLVAFGAADGKAAVSEQYEEMNLLWSNF